MKITVIGSGAIGGVIGAYLAKEGEDITFVDIVEEHIDIIRNEGLTIQLKDDSFKVQGKAYTVEEFVKLNEKLDVVFLCVKAQHTKSVLKSIKHMLKLDSAVVSMQNGLCEPMISEIIGENRTIGCFVNLFADYIKPGLINYGGVGSVYIGELNGKVTTRIKDIHESLSFWGEAKITDNIMGYIWGKLSYLVVLIATALTDEKIADLIENGKWKKLFLDIASEVLEVADKINVKPEGFDNWEPSLIYPIENRDWNKINNELDLLIKRLRSYTKVKSGIWRDLSVRKRKTEVHSQYEPILSIAESVKVNMPKTQSLIYMILEIENGSRKMSIDNLEELKASS